ncbi:TIGR00730 family Rossman fold protein [Streptomyces cacaoi]|uniref:Cytokinin riboside 5'-monophosphate phosphoribohydrolase n=1 Tax=Streptomyces cacaoi TaxID=1898 RepID=A0A4Y3QV50_STRCI|nr:TIGR00730 family Rossman fold protein [Streptomyces cacaoi]NNG83381.1 TIGR00730 family Rossman fold protein [Streptomyces cacaoi]GEB49284.1 hypothetical protein SCA03_18350 [Streptomyces cacaoi]
MATSSPAGTPRRPASDESRTLPASVCVFCGSADGPHEGYRQTAEKLGLLIAERGHRLVYGAGGIGLMGAVARAAQLGGAQIHGVIPAFLREREVGDELPDQTLELTDSLAERKRVMIERSDAFIALPGGYGTLDEVLEILSMAALGLPVGPLVLLDVDGDWTGLDQLVASVHARGFARDRELFGRATSPAQALDLVAARMTPAGAARATG